MSFSKSKTKRFNEVVGCAPPVGSYDPNLNQDGNKGPISFDKSDRFKLPKEPSPPSQQPTFCLVTPRKLFNTSQSSEGSTKKLQKKPVVIQDLSKVTDLEKEARNLLQEKVQLLKDVSSKEEECKKIESKLQTANREKTFLNSNVASLVKELKSLRKANEILKTKISTLESSGIKRNECLSELAQLKENLVVKKLEIEELSNQLKVAQASKQETFEECQAKDEELRGIQTELENLRSNYNEANLHIREIEDKNSGLGAKVLQLCEQLSEMELGMKEVQEHNSKLENEQEMFIGEMDSLQERHLTEVHDFLTKMSDLGSENVKLKSDFENLKVKIEACVREKELMEQDKSCSILLQEYKNTLEERIAVQKDAIEELHHQQNENDNLICNLKIDVKYLRKELSDKEQQIFENRAEVAEYAENVEQLKENEKCLTQNIKCFTDKCQELNEMIEFERITNKEQEERLQSQIELIQSSLDTANEQIDQISANNVVLISRLHSEKNLSDQKMQEAKELEVQLSGNKESLERKENEFLELWKVSQQKDKDLEVMHKSKEMCIEELRSLKQEFQSAQYLLADLRSEIALIKSTCEARKEEICILQKDKGDLVSDMEKASKVYRDMCDDYRGQIDQYSRDKDRQSEEIVRLTECWAIAEEEKIELLAKLQEINLKKAEEEFSEISKTKLDSDELRKEFETLREILTQSGEKEQMMKTEIENLTSKCHELSSCDRSNDSKASLLQEKLEKMEQELQDKEISYLAELSAAESEHIKKLMEIEQTIENLKHENDSKTSELEKWKTLYEQTLPFKEHAHLYLIEKKQLMEQKTEIEESHNLLKEQYAELLGHNNKKQKIKHIMKLKQDNLNLKDELDKVREVCAKQKWQLENIEQRFLVGDVKRKSTFLGKENFPKPLCQSNIRKNQLQKKSLSQSSITQNAPEGQTPRVSTNYGLL